MATENQDEIVLKIKLDDGSVVNGFLKIEKTAVQTQDKIKKAQDETQDSQDNHLKNIAGKFDDALGGIPGKIKGFITNPIGGAFALAGASALYFKSTLDTVLKGEKELVIKKNFDFIAQSVGLSGSQMQSAFKDVSKDMLSMSDILQNTSKKIPELGENAKKLPRLLDLAMRAAKVSGKDAVETFDTLTGALISLETRSLKEFGIRINTNELFKASNALDETAKRAALTDAIIENLDKRFGSIDPAVDNTTSAYKRFKIAVAEAGDAAAISTAKSSGPAVKAALNAATDSVNLFTRSFKTLTGQSTFTDELANSIADLQKESEFLKNTPMTGLTGSETKARITAVSTEIGILTKRLQDFNNAQKDESLDPRERIRMLEKTSDSLERFNARELKLAALAFTVKEKLRQGEVQIMSDRLASEQAVFEKKKNIANLELIINDSKLIENKNFEIKKAELQKFYADNKDIDSDQRYLLNQQALEMHNQKMLEIDRRYAEEKKTLEEQKRIESMSTWESLSYAGSSSLTALQDEFRQTAASSGVEFQKVRKNVADGVETGFTKAFSAAGKAMGKGKDGMKAFEQVTQEMVASAASAFGDYYIQQGVARIALSYGSDVTGWQMLAAGVALNALAGANGAGGGSADAGSGGGGGIAASPSAVTENTATTQAQDPTTRVQLIVQGSIYDSEDTAKRMVDLLNESTLKNGTTLLQG